MELNYITEFVTLAETKNYLQAADQLFIAQSALSRHIKILESELGIQLFNRTTRSVELTEYGKIFLPYAKTIQQVQYDYTTAINNHTNSVSGTVTIGTLPVTVPYHIPDILAKFSRENKNFNIVLTENDDIEQLRTHRADFIFLRETGIKYQDIITLPFDSDNLAAILPLDHPLAKNKSIQLEQLKGEDFLMLPKTKQLGSLCINACKTAGFEPQIRYSGLRADNLLALVREHIGIGLLTKKPLRFLNLEGISIVDIEPKITTPISLAYLKNEKLSTSATHFLNCVKSFIASRSNAREKQD